VLPYPFEVGSECSA
jgi:hypothetical protein